MQQSELQEEEGISIIDIFRLFLSKIKFLIIALLIGGILGASFAVWRTVNINHYGTKVEFYVNPEKPRDPITDDNSQYGVYGAYGKHVMDNMIKLLGSESFAEQMILNGERLPEKDTWSNLDNKEQTDKLNGKIDAATAELAKLDEVQALYNKTMEARTSLADELSEAKEILDSQWVALSYKKKDNGDDFVTSLSFNEYEYNTQVKVILAGSPDFAAAQPVQEAYEAWNTLRADLKAKDEELENQKEALTPVQENTDEVVEEALEEWRKTAKYQSTLAKYSNAVKFSYVRTGENTDDVNDLARSFIYVEVFVLNDYEFACEVLQRVKTVVPDYVEEKMTVPSGYVGTNCKRITRTDDIRMTNPGYNTQQAIKYGLLAAFAALVIACIAVVIIDKSDKRLRDTAIITKRFNVPLLGLIPSIDELKETPSDKNDKTEVK